MEKWLVVNSLFHSLTRCFEVYNPLKLVVLKVFWGGLNRARVGEKLFFLRLSTDALALLKTGLEEDGTAVLFGKNHLRDWSSLTPWKSVRR